MTYTPFAVPLPRAATSTTKTQMTLGTRANKVGLLFIISAPLSSTAVRGNASCAALIRSGADVNQRAMDSDWPSPPIVTALSRVGQGR